jgi:hypothetical protein
LRHPIEDDVNVGSVLRIVAGLAGGIEVHLQTSREKTANGKLGAACLMAALCLNFSVTGFAQDSSSTSKTAASSASTKKTSANSAAKTKKPTSTGSTSASAKTHKSTSSTAHQHSASSKSSATLHNSKSKRSTSRSKKTTARGQQKIDSERAQAIQEALIREHYLSGDPTGKWNDDSEAAMRRYQADHGWQSKTVPDSRALISLGLGPSHDHLLNPESAMTTGPFPPRAEPLAPSSNSADPGPQVKTSPSATSPAQASSPEHDAPNQQ